MMQALDLPTSQMKMATTEYIQMPMFNSTNIVQFPTSMATSAAPVTDFSFLHNWIGFRRLSESERKQQLRQRNENPYSLTMMSVELAEATAFINLLGDEKIRTLFQFDMCCKMADRYLVAMVFVYFKRAEFMIAEYNPVNFFLALHLAHDMEEDEDSWKEDILPLALGVKWRSQKLSFLIHRDRLWKRIGYRAVVSNKSCKAVFTTVQPDHPVWQRERPLHHSFALRAHHRNPDELEPTDDRPFIRFCPDCFCKRN